MSDMAERLNAALEGRYVIERELGEGGMATVYLSKDLKHNRSVALKVLKPELAAVVGAERFLAEIETTANLTHPHILPLHDSGEADGFLFYVMPHIEGETLRDRVDREKQLPVDEAVALASKVAGALQHAHEHGVIHRDIKPGNILLQDGEPVVSDFGIALALGVAGGTRLTETGLSVGTPFYMSPEQATGDQAVGASTDIYALGSVLYEMLVGDPPFAGSTAQAVLGKIIAGKSVSAREERPSVPANVDAAVRKALEKLPADRFASAQEFVRALGDEHFRHGGVAGAGVTQASGQWNRLTAGFATATVALAALAGWSILGPETSSQEGIRAVRFGIPVRQGTEVLPDGTEPRFDRTPVTALAFSPDGNLLVYAASGDSVGSGRRMYTQRLDQERADLIEGAERSHLPFFSPSGEWIGFVGFSDGAPPALKRLSVADGTIETIAEMPTPEAPGITWGDDGTIVLSSFTSLYQVAATGGEWEVLVEADSVSSERYFQPHMLPGSETLLFHLARSYDPEQADIVALDLATKTQKMVLTNAMDPRYLQTGHLLFMRQGTLMAVGFDLERIEVLGQPVIMVEDVMHSLYGVNTGLETGAAQVAVSAAGHLAYVRGGVTPERPVMPVRITSTGDTVRLDMDPRDYIHFRVSPDGNRLAAVARHGQQQEIWVHDLARGTNQRLNTGGFTNWPMAWSPDGQWIAFSSDRDGPLYNMYRFPADGSGEPEHLAASERAGLISSWSSQGVIAWLEAGDIWVLPPDGDPAPFFQSQFNERYPTFSPDGRWLAYASNQSGPSEIYVRPYPGPAPATPISSDGGVAPAWSLDGRRLYFRQGRVLMAIDVAPGDPFGAGRAVPLIDPWTSSAIPVRSFDVFADGSFVTAVREEPDGDPRDDLPAELRVILNFLDEVRARVPN